MNLLEDLSGCNLRARQSFSDGESRVKRRHHVLGFRTDRQKVDNTHIRYYNDTMNDQEEHQ